MNISARQSGFIGIFAAILVGSGEYLLHYDAAARFTAQGYDYLRGIDADRTSVGHFLAAFGAPLYVVGCFHFYQTLKPASHKWALSGFLLAAYGFIIGAMWIASRASISAIMQLPTSPESLQLIELYRSRYEPLLATTRYAILAFSLIYIKQILTGKTLYPKWMALFNPITLLVASFGLFVAAPDIGKHAMPIALNIAFFIVFSLSTWQVIKQKPAT